MKEWSAAQVAEAAGAELVREAAVGGGPAGAYVDSRAGTPGELFVGIPGARADGGSFAGAALQAGAWGALVGPGWRATEGDGALLVADDPAAALASLATAWRRALGMPVVGITGSTGKTSTKELLAAVLRPHRAVVASRANFNTEIGLPLELLRAPAGTEVLVLEMAMRGAGQIAELAAIAEPDVGVIVNVGPVHLELLGSLEAIAAAKAELVAGLAPGARAVMPAGEPLLEPHRRADLETVTFGPGGDAHVIAEDGGALRIALPGGIETEVEVGFTQAHQRLNLLAALAAAQAVGVVPRGRLDAEIGAGRGRQTLNAHGVLVVDDCYNANPMSVRAALDELAHHRGRRLAVLGDMLELGPDEERFHAQIGAHAAARGVDVLVAVGPRAAAMAPAFGGESHRAADAQEAADLVARLARPGDAVLVKASRGVGLERVVEALEGSS